jgi:hypothetical protein
MPAGDTCISGLFTPGAINASPGLDPTRVIVPSFLDPEDYDPTDPSILYSLNFSKFYNAMYYHYGEH